MKSRATEAGRFVTHDGAELYYELRGAGSPVVLVAGVGDDIASWDTVEPLADDHVLVAFGQSRGQAQLDPARALLDRSHGR